MITIDELHIRTNYRFDLGSYIAVGKYVSRNANLLTLEEAFIYLNGNKNRFLFEEALVIDATALKNITVSESEPRQDNSDYYLSYDYNS